MLKLTRLNRSVVAINPDHVSWIDVSPDTTLCLINGEKILVRESLDELISRLIDFRRQIRTTPLLSSIAPHDDGGSEPGALETVAEIRRFTSRPPHGEEKR